MRVDVGDHLLLAIVDRQGMEALIIYQCDAARGRIRDDRRVKVRID